MPCTKRVVVTDTAGLIGGVLSRFLNNHWYLYGVDLLSTPDIPIVLQDINNQKALIRLFKKSYAIVVLAGNSKIGSSWNEIINSNIISTISVFEAANKAGVRKIIYASSNQVTGLYEKYEPYKSIVEGKYKNLKPNQIPMITKQSPVRPNGPYGIRKAFGEALGRPFNQ